MSSLRSLSTDKLFHGSFALFLCLQFAVTAASPHTVGYYAIVLPTALACLWQQRDAAKALCANHSLRWFMVFFGYLITHALVMGDAQEGLSKTIRNSCATASFVFIAVLFFSTLATQQRQRLFTAIGLTAGLCAAISLICHIADPHAEERLRPIGRADSQVLGAFLYTMGAIFALEAIHLSRNKRIVLLLTLAISLCLWLVILTQSRMALSILSLSLLLGIIYHCSHCYRRLLLASAMIAGVAALLSLLLYEPLESYLTTQIARGDSFRFALWQQAIARILEAPWQGYGLFARIDFTYQDYHITSPHNVYLATALVAGVPAMVVLLMAITHLGLNMLFRLSLRQPAVFFTGLLIVNALAAGMIDLHRIIKGPSPLWIIFWLPLAMGVAELVRYERKTD